MVEMPEWQRCQNDREARMIEKPEWVEKLSARIWDDVNADGENGRMLVTQVLECRLMSMPSGGRRTGRGCRDELELLGNRDKL